MWFCFKQNHWVPRRDENKPKTIEQIHREAKQEELQRHMLSQLNTQQSVKRNRRKFRELSIKLSTVVV